MQLASALALAMGMLMRVAPGVQVLRNAQGLFRQVVHWARLSQLQRLLACWGQCLPMRSHWVQAVLLVLPQPVPLWWAVSRGCCRPVVLLLHVGLVLRGAHLV